MKRVVAIRHVPFEDLGTFAPTLLQAGYTIEYRNAPLDNLGDSTCMNADLLVILGAPIGAYEDHHYPFIASELKLVEHRLAADKPLLGVCFGAQLIARASGARVYAGPHKEIGWAPITLTAAGEQSPLAALEQTEPVLHWHGDTFDLPYGSTLLASTSLYPHQAYSLGAHVLGLQFHAETSPMEIENWLVGHAVELAAANILPQALRQGAQSARAQGALLMARWLQQHSA